MLPAFLLTLASGEGGGSTHYFAPGNNHHDQVLLRFNSSTLDAVQAVEGFEDAVPLFDYWTSPSLGSPFDVRVLASSVSEIRARLASHFVSVEVVVPDIQTLIDNEAAGRASSRSNRWLPGEYHSTDQINTYFRDTAVPNYAQIASTFSIGTSTEGRDLQVVRITGGPKNTSCSLFPAPACKPSYNGKPAIWFQSTIHAREWLTGASTEVMVDKILKDYATDASIRQMVDSLDLYFLIIANPDGYEYSRDTDRWWRKTRSPNAGSSCVGTDPNRRSLCRSRCRRGPRERLQRRGSNCQCWCSS